MLDETQKVQHFVDGRQRIDLDANEMLAYAVIRAIELIGEAAARVTDETRNQYPQIPWKNIIGMRNRIIHDYNNVNLDIVWQVANRNLPELALQLIDILPPEKPM
ncbi:MAG: HepT-like ribonuclease domain-containing protein [Anaerolineae bacterium]